MLLVIPTTPAVRPTSYLAPQPYGYYPDHDYYSRYEAPQFAATSYPSDLDFFRRPSAEELEEREYRRALEVVTSHRRRQVEKEAVIHRQQLAEAARQRYFSALAAELEQQRRKELLAARRAEFARLQQARARLVANERQNALKDFLRQCDCPQPVTRQPYVAKRRPIADALKQRLATESDVDITELIENVLSSLAPRPAESNEAKDTSEGSSKFIEKLLSSIFPGLATSTQPQSTPPTQQVQPDASDKGKGKARAVDIEEPQKPAEKPKSADETFANILRHVMELSKSAPTVPRSHNEAGPSGSSHAPSTPAHPPVSEKEQAQVDRALALSSVEHIQNTLTKLQADFVLPDELDHYSPSTDDRDETASVSSVSSSDLTKLVPYTRTNKPVYKYENELNGLLEELDRIDSHGDADVREKRKEVVKAVEKALENLENAVGESVGKRLSLIGTTESPVEEPLKGFDVDDSTTEEAILTQEQVEIPVVDETAVVSEPFAPVEAEKMAVTPAETAFPVEGVLPESSTPIIPETAVDLPFEPSSSQSDLEASSVTVTPASLEPTPATKPEPESPQVQADAQEVVDTFLLPENVSPPSPVQKPREMGSDIEDDVLSLDSDADKSDWSEVEH